MKTVFVSYWQKTETGYEASFEMAFTFESLPPVQEGYQFILYAEFSEKENTVGLTVYPSVERVIPFAMPPVKDADEEALIRSQVKAFNITECGVFKDPDGKEHTFPLVGLPSYEVHLANGEKHVRPKGEVIMCFKRK